MSVDLDTIPWPQHKCSLLISHNRHKDYYETTEDAIGSDDTFTYHRDDFPDEAEIAKAIATEIVCG